MKKYFFKRWLLLAFIVIAAINFAACSDSDNSKSTLNDRSQTQQKSTSTPEPTPESTPEPRSDSDTFYTIGETAVIGDLAITLDGGSTSLGDELFQPSEGNVYLFLEFTITNNSDEVYTFSSLLCTEAYVDDKFTDLDIIAMSSCDDPSLDGEIQPGEKLSGILGYEVPEDFEEFDVIITPDFFSDDSVTFSVVNSR